MFENHEHFTKKLKTFCNVKVKTFKICIDNINMESICECLHHEDN